MNEKAVAVALWQDGGSIKEHISLKELTALAKTAEVEIIEDFIQHRDRPDRRYYLGPGKVNEIGIYLEENQVSTVIFDCELSPSQVNNLEKKLSAKVIDRSELILDIFARRANTKEGKLQVELAQLQYQLPKLVGQRRDLSRLAGGIGTRGPGETKLETDRRHIRHRINVLKREIKALEKHRSLIRQRRQRAGVFQVALVGYTNSGKSTLLNSITAADTYAADALFATLDPLSRRLETDQGPLVISDTVGFISGLPHHLIAAFKATLEVAVHADLLVHVVDVAEPEAHLRLAEVNAVLTQLECQDKDQIIAANKIDLVDNLGELASLFREAPPHIPISASTGKNIPALKEAIIARMNPRIFLRARLPLEIYRKISRSQPGQITPIEFSREHVIIEARLPRELAESLSVYEI
ncbi:MAG: GTPase HflX [Firmicutes bacterium]|nr:GTPase HflX [Bacillota bacterium]